MGSSKIAVIDIGSNSFHMIIGGYINQLYYQITDDVKVNVRLGEGLNETGRISDERMDFGIQTLIMYANICRAEGLERVITVATEAVRRASNGHEFVRRAKEEAGLDVTIIPGVMEAELDYLGCVNSLDIKDAVMMDIGGASAEFVLIRDRKNVASVSLPFGSITLSEKFDLEGEIRHQDLKKLKSYVKDNLKEIDFLREAKGLPVIGVGGTIRNIGRIHRQLIDYPLEIAHNYVMTEKEVNFVIQEVAGVSASERQSFPGLSKGRTNIFVGPASALDALLRYLDAPKLVISDYGLRDGVIFDHFGLGPDNLIHDVFQNSLVNTAVQYDADLSHAYQVLGIVNLLYNKLESLFSVKCKNKKIIQTSCVLHDIGAKIKYRNHHEHSFYLILNAGLQGISQKDILLSAFIALHHRSNKKIRIDEIYKPLLTEEDRILIDEISLLLQIAEQLDRSLDGAVKDIHVDIQDDAVVLHAISVNHSVFSEIVMDECAKKFRRVTGKELLVQNTVVPLEEAEEKVFKDNPF